MASNTMGATLFGAGTSGGGGVGAVGPTSNPYGPVGHGSSEQVTGGRRSRFGISSTSAFGMTPLVHDPERPREAPPDRRELHHHDDAQEMNDQNPVTVPGHVRTDSVV